jgi:peptide/nickel transport system ATP-binding protein/oligopeptide transport system ATP-binding protein
VDNVSLDVPPNKLVAVVGESGCGKSTLGLSIIGLLPMPPAKILSGSIYYKGTDLIPLDAKRRREFRGTEVAMIFQEPLTSLNPVYKIGDQIAEAIVVREDRKTKNAKGVKSNVMQSVYNSKTIGRSRFLRNRGRMPAELKEEVIESLKLVRIGDPEQVIERYPFELSGGMRQRVMIAMALSQKPSLLIADEPTTALDVTTQAQVLRMMKELMEEVNTSIFLVSHDLAVASQVADDVVVMYAGEIVEHANVYDLFSDPLHPYSKGLLSCIPSGAKDETKLEPIPGNVPDPLNPPKGCRFAPRCPFVMDVCNQQRPRLIDAKPGHKVECFLYGR